MQQQVIWMAGMLAIALAAGCARQEGGGGGPVAVAPVTLTMVPRMIEGQGHVTYTPRGDQVEIRLHAENLPPPATYSLELVGPVKASHVPMPPHAMGPVPVRDGRVDLTFTMPTRDLVAWQGIDLVHLPSGKPTDTRQAHPSLSASIPLRQVGR